MFSRSFRSFCWLRRYFVNTTFKHNHWRKSAGQNLTWTTWPSQEEWEANLEQVQRTAIKSFNSHLNKISVLHSDMPNLAYLNPVCFLFLWHGAVVSWGLTSFLYLTQTATVEQLSSSFLYSSIAWSQSWTLFIRVIMYTCSDLEVLKVLPVFFTDFLRLVNELTWWSWPVGLPILVTT